MIDYPEYQAAIDEANEIMDEFMNEDVRSNEEIDSFAAFVCAHSDMPLSFYWEDATPGCGVVFVPNPQSY